MKLNDAKLNELERKYRRLEHFIMESKKFERFALYSIAGCYGYILFHICYWIGRNLF